MGQRGNDGACAYAYSEEVEQDDGKWVLASVAIAMSARIVELEAKLAQTWQPVADGEFKCDCSDLGCPNIISTEADGMFLTLKEKDSRGVFVTVDLGRRRLCRKQESAE